MSPATFAFLRQNLHAHWYARLLSLLPLSSCLHTFFALVPNLLVLNVR